MPDIGNWLADTTASRAADAWSRINDKPASVTIYRDRTRTTPDETLDPQTVRLEFSSTVRELMGEGGRSSIRDLIVFGVRGHESVPDTDIRRGDVFEHAGGRYRVVDVLMTTGEVQARAEMLT